MAKRVSLATARTHRERGAVAVEMALVLPVLIALVFGILEFGRAFNAKLELSSAVREGARSLAVGASALDVVDTVAASAPALDAAELAAPGAVIVSASPCLPGSQATVTVNYPFTYTIAPFFKQATITLTATGVMRCEL